MGRLRLSLAQVLVQIPPFGIGGQDQAYLPRPRPMLQIALALKRVANVFIEFPKNEEFEPIPLGEPFDAAFPMLPASPRDVVRHAGIERAVRPVRHDINPTSAHPNMLARRG